MSSTTANMQDHSMLIVPPSESMSPSSSPEKSSRVCLNCRRKKKKCDKKLPSCGRCNYSLEVCQHEGDPGTSSEPDIYLTPSFDMFGVHRMVSPFEGAGPSGLSSLPFTGPAIDPALFAAIEHGEDIHHYVMRSLVQIVGPQQAVSIASEQYFGTINTWFNVVEKSTFSIRLESFWDDPSADFGLLVLCMALLVRIPDSAPDASMRDSFYFSAKTLTSLAEANVPLSTSLLQANLLLSMYEVCHAMPLQAYMTLGGCIHTVRAFGWLSPSYWSQDRIAQEATNLKSSSILWWAIELIDTALRSEIFGYPSCVPELGFSVPFPAIFDQYLQSTNNPAFHYADDGNDRIIFTLWPEAASTGFLKQVGKLNSSGINNQAAQAQLTHAIIDHARQVMSRPWSDGHRFGSVSIAYLAILRLNFPHLAAPSFGIGSTTPSSQQQQQQQTQATPQITAATIERIRPLIVSIFRIANDIIESAQVSTLAINIPTMAHCLHFAAMVLARYGLMLMPDWLTRMRGLQACLGLYARRWNTAEKLAEHLHRDLQVQIG